MSSEEIKLYTFYPQDLKDFDYKYLIELCRSFINEDALIDLYNKDMPKHLQYKKLKDKDGHFTTVLPDANIEKIIKNNNLEKTLLSLAWRASADKQSSKYESVKVLKHIDEEIIEDSEAIRDVVGDTIKKNSFGETLNLETEDIDDSMHFNSGYMLRYFLGAFMPSDEALNEWKETTEKNGFFIPPLEYTEAQRLMQESCKHFANKGGNVDFIKLHLTRLMNQYLIDQNHLKRAVLFLNKYNNEYDEASLNFTKKWKGEHDEKYLAAYKEFDKEFDEKHEKQLEYIESIERYFKLVSAYDYDEINKINKKYEKIALKIQLLLIELDYLDSPYDELVKEVQKNSESDIRTAISAFDMPLLKNVLFCKRELFIEKRRTLSIETGKDLLVPNTPEFNAITKLLTTIKCIEKEFKTESE